MTWARKWELWHLSAIGLEFDAGDTMATKDYAARSVYLMIPTMYRLITPFSTVNSGTEGI